MTLGGTRDRPGSFVKRVFDGPQAICHSAFSRGWKICHYGARRDFSPPPSEGEGEGREG